MNEEWHRHPTLTGDRVRLEPLGTRHAEGLYRAGRDPGVWTWLSSHQPTDVAGSRAQIEHVLAEADRLAWAQIDTRTGQVAGTTSYYQIDPAHRNLLIGHTWIGVPWQRTPLNTEAKLLLLRRAFEVLGATRVAWETDIRNERSQRAIARLGATREGLLRAHRIRKDGSLRDTVVYSVTAGEWPAVRDHLLSRTA
ncbi:GNAT family N-acetyltransferase [Amycolatopsis cihanbeyliensis]|uniref:RimJ/RimL family protein N-acetyltransferase n=1 Tax=Amycolatopsis cihanbeyliensis TaxID=1128664 RepID=A0A542DN94_AMYCI|nr:GNAT family protein [Amycolatopsis cihanbeyliensis]TQJ04454.1 RimJ/RimL family protein N-acetyltransferase [Amycolatopsis cihanbeyliensis]